MFFLSFSTALTPVTAPLSSVASDTSAVSKRTSTAWSASAVSHRPVRSSDGFVMAWKPPFSPMNGVSKRKFFSSNVYPMSSSCATASFDVSRQRRMSAGFGVQCE